MQGEDAEQERRPDALHAPMVSGRGAKRGRAPITRDAIVKTALRVLDQEGLEHLTMRRVADELDTGPASLYWHVANKDSLLDLVFDEIIGEQQVPDPEPERWKEQLKDVGRAARRVILSHRDVVRLSVGRIPTGPNALRYSERVLAILRVGGVPDQLAVTGHHLLLAVVNGFTLDEAEETPGSAEPTDPGEVGDFISSLPAEHFPNLVAVARHFAIADNDRRFELLLDLFVDGLAQRVASVRAS